MPLIGANISRRAVRGEAVEPLFKQPALTGSEALDLTAIAAIASELTASPITRVTVSDKEYRAGLISRGVPESRADLLLGLFAASRKGEFAAVDLTLERLLGRPPVTLRDVLAARLSERLTTFF